MKKVIVPRKKAGELFQQVDFPRGKRGKWVAALVGVVPTGAAKGRLREFPWAIYADGWNGSFHDPFPIHPPTILATGASPARARRRLRRLIQELGWELRPWRPESRDVELARLFGLSRKA